jgi:photosystem II stability/assembly factor-like uncharacterized protein/uncharacterized cupin superfamily protein
MLPSVKWRLLLVGALTWLNLGTIGCGGGQETTHISTVTPHINSKAHRRLLAEIARHRTRVARANADQPVSIAFWDAERGLVGGGYEYQRTCAGTVSLTTDGGRTFHVVLRTSAVVFWVETTGASDAWAEVQRCRKRRHPPPLPELLHTADGGGSWHRVFTGLAWNPSFATASDGFAVAAERGTSYVSLGAGVDHGQVLSTSDGGRTWHGGVGLCRDSDDAAVSFPTLAQSWVVCTSTSGAGTQYKTVFSSPDRGATWQELARTQPKRSSQPAGGITESGYVHGLTFAEGGSGLLFLDRRPVYRTDDGGRTWRPLPWSSFPAFPSGRKADYVNSAAMLSPTTALALIVNGDRDQVQLTRTEDAGQSWSEVHTWTPPGRSR